jgi:hypothetical protein
MSFHVIHVLPHGAILAKEQRWAHGRHMAKRRSERADGRGQIANGKWQRGKGGGEF